MGMGKYERDTTSIENYKDGKLNGPYLEYHDNGQIMTDCSYLDGEYDGEFKIYGSKGNLISKSHYNKGEFDGATILYHKIGETSPKYVMNYKDGLPEGEFVEYHKNGALATKVSFKDGKKEGAQLNYFSNGQISEESNYVNGLLEGTYKSFYTNGSLREEGIAKEDYFDGTYSLYYPNGNLEIQYNLKNGTYDGPYTEYDYDGKAYNVLVYKNGLITSFQNLDKNGNIVSEGKKKGGAFEYQGLSPQGVLVAEGTYDLKGGKEGDWKYYTNNGVLTDDSFFDNNQLVNKRVTHYATGERSFETEYRNGKKEGYEISLFRNQKTYGQGWYDDDQRFGQWEYYNPDGVVTESYFYVDGEQNGLQKDFSKQGKLSGTRSYDLGTLEKETVYHRDGSIHEVIDLSAMTSDRTELVTHHFNGKVKNRYTYKNGIKHGKFEKYNHDGILIVVGNYTNGTQDGEWKWYYPNGQLETQCTYILGSLDGTYRRWYESGELERENNYLLGSRHGAFIDYFKNGNKESEATYVQDLMNGERKFYSSEGTLQLSRHYDYGTLIGYSYLDKTGTQIPMISIERETGKIEAFYPDGNPSRTMEFKNGELENSYKEYFESGQLYEEMNFVSGDYEAIKTSYYSNGNKENECNYVSGAKHGEETEYYENGEMKKKTPYVHGDIDGTQIEYDESGNKIRETTYFDDEVVDVKNFDI